MAIIRDSLGHMRIIAEICNESTMNCKKLQLNERLVAERNRLGLTQEAMAAGCETPKRTYCDYESGKSEPRGSFFEALAKIGGDVGFVVSGVRTAGELTADEAALIENYRAISEERKGNLIDLSAALSLKQQAERKAG